MTLDRTVFGSTITFGGASAPEPTAIRDALWNWVARGEMSPPAWEVGQHAFGNRDVVCREAHRDAQDLWELELRHPDADVIGVTWRAVVDLLVDGGRTSLAVDLRQLREESATEEVEPGVPGIVRWAVERGAQSGRIPLTLEAAEVRGGEQVEELVEGWLRDSERTIPVVVFTAFSDRPGVYGLTEEGIQRFASGVVGIAKVVRIPDPSDTFGITDRLGRQLRVFNGSTRVYWPQLDRGIHPLFLPARMNRFAVQALAAAIRSGTAEQFRPPLPVRGLLAFQARADERAVLEARIDAARGLEEKAARLEEEILQLRARLDDSGDRVAALESEIVDRDGRIAELDAAHSIYQARMAARLATEDPLVVRARSRREIGGLVLERLRDLVEQVEAEVGDQAADQASGVDEQAAQVESYVPEDFAEAILMAAEYFSGTIEIKRAAEDAALNMQPDRVTPAKLWEALQTMDAVVTLWQQEQLPTGGIAGALEERGYRVGRVSPTAFGQFRHEYEFTHGNRRVALDEHIRLGQRYRIYWFSSDEERRFIVNHIGHHLSDKSSG